MARGSDSLEHFASIDFFWVMDAQLWVVSVPVLIALLDAVEDQLGDEVGGCSLLEA